MFKRDLAESTFIATSSTGPNTGVGNRKLWIMMNPVPVTHETKVSVPTSPGVLSGAFHFRQR